MARSNLVTKRAPPSGDAKRGPPKSIKTLAGAERSVLDFVFHTRFVRRHIVFKFSLDFLFGNNKYSARLTFKLNVIG